VKISQQTGGDGWVPLAAGKEFEAGKKGFVRLFNDTEEQAAVVVADAVAFLYVGAGKASQTANR
ncbi:MAG: hypothetical protein JWM68_827, partial [Verrucomicrobiales bacterium]|nr:hypothetical protein [Verrucomicrobiales bacterium]